MPRLQSKAATSSALGLQEVAFLRAVGRGGAASVSGAFRTWLAGSGLPEASLLSAHRLAFASFCAQARNCDRAAALYLGALLQP